MGEMYIYADSDGINSTVIAPLFSFSLSLHVTFSASSFINTISSYTVFRHCRPLNYIKCIKFFECFSVPYRTHLLSQSTHSPEYFDHCNLMSCIHILNFFNAPFSTTSLICATVYIIQPSSLTVYT